MCEPAAKPHLMRALHDSVRASGKAAPHASTSRQCASTTNQITRKKLIKKKKLVGYIELVNIAHKLFICLNIRITNNTYKLNFINL